MENKPIYRRIADSIIESIQKGGIVQDTKLPSIRKLAKEYDVSNLTALNAMRLLEDERIVYAMPKKGYFVRSTLLSFDGDNISNEKEQLYSLLASENDSGLTLSNGHIDLYPVQKISKIMRKQIYQNPNLLGGCISGHGHELLIDEIIRRAIEYGCSFSKNEICITNGGLESLSLALRATTSPGDTVLVQSPTYFYTLKFISELGLKCISVRKFDDIEHHLESHKIKVMVFNANFNNPDGMLLDESQKQRLVELSKLHRFTIIEDDVYGDIHFTERRPKPLRAYSSDIILCNTFTKAIGPGLRIGWIAASNHTSQVKELKQSTSKYTAEFPQAAIAEFLRSGGYDLHMRKLRATLASFRDEVRLTILETFPEGTWVSKPEGGFVLWVKLPHHLPNLETKIEQALSLGNYFVPGHFFSLEEDYNHCLRLNFGFGLTEEVKTAIQQLGRTFSE
ncbi:PLP-dependent aminotransferase family protein [Vibrio sp. 404]|uniref:PLP-dependent aminotransferase family protein n=1 Tax=Vibrio marinisediminis TaxID=2758441 RepID=A0A7W2FRK8_9VIBR|nr:PLP-dependent aminotransferase family protein [Vibrio marinisediminis]MBA5762960.1 PLP-dependent aminotransferase family protein [Vibrio marinisediminis]